MCVLSWCKKATGCYCVVARCFYSLFGGIPLMTSWDFQGGIPPMTSWDFHILCHNVHFLYTAPPGDCFHGDVGRHIS